LSKWAAVNLRSVGSNPRNLAVGMLTVWAAGKLGHQEGTHA